MYTHIEHGIPSAYEPLLEPLIRNNLRLDKSGEQSGNGKYAEHFLCADINEKDLPWALGYGPRRLVNMK